MQMGVMRFELTSKALANFSPGFLTPKALANFSPGFLTPKALANFSPGFLTPKALANFSPGFGAQRQPWGCHKIKPSKPERVPLAANPFRVVRLSWVVPGV